MRTPQVAAMPRLITGIRTVLCLATWVGCESTSPSSLVEYSLTGTVYDTARRPLAEVHIGVAAGSRVGVSAVSDGAGHYELPGTFTGAQVLRAEKPGFAPVTILHHSSVSGPSRRDIYLTNPETADVSGDWTVTLIANSSCTEIPEAIRTRSYRGSIRLENYPPHHFDLKLQSDALTSNWSNNISVSVSGTDARFEIEAWDWGLGIVEDLVSRDPCSSGGRAADRRVTRRWLAPSRAGSNTRTTLARHRWESSSVSPFNWKRSDGEPGAAVSINCTASIARLANRS